MSRSDKVIVIAMLLNVAAFFIGSLANSDVLLLFWFLTYPVVFVLGFKFLRNPARGTR